ncbi:hypothetical protein B1813_02870 [Saccharomonospora piscinae]|uniref:Antibiotic biosynthesis monooxygenase n=1 Tax=Saccharomonospora piscinae TaxID=687388 RepID=A0A1V9ADB2_SACPI|nr:antibiotic biosynthesis monooxygenase [Saccharomonospora piscinae]OQO95018.1 hypothetical protein B1813_02870 [Saccharomonospora piscinae]
MTEHTETHTETSPLPDVSRTDADAAVVRTLTLDAPDPVAQRRTAEAALRRWGAAPPAGLLSHSVLLGTDERTVSQYTQWADVDALPGEEHEAGAWGSPVVARVYRSVPPAQRVRARMVVLISFDLDTAATGRAFVDELLASHHPLSTGAAEVDNLGASHFHLSVDGSKMINWAEFAAENTHQRLVETRLREDDPVPRLVASTPGLTGRGFRRYRPYGTVTGGHPS